VAPVVPVAPALLAAFYGPVVLWVFLCVLGDMPDPKLLIKQDPLLLVNVLLRDLLLELLQDLLAPAAATMAAPVYKTYSDPDVGNVLPAFTTNRPVGIHFGHPLLGSTMTREVEFFRLFFTMQMVVNICEHTNSYSNEHLLQGAHQSYA